MGPKTGEQIESRQVLFSLVGIPVTVSVHSLQFAPPKLVIGMVIALLTRAHEPIMTWFLWGLIYGSLLLSVLLLHILGHILSSKLVAPPMTEARVTPVLIQTLYQNDTSDIPVRTHL